MEFRNLHNRYMMTLGGEGEGGQNSINSTQFCPEHCFLWVSLLSFTILLDFESHVVFITHSNIKHISMCLLNRNSLLNCSWASSGADHI